MSEKTLDLPFSPDVARSLELGEIVYLTGEIVATAGYPTHQRIVAAIEAGEEPPIALAGAALFHLGCMSRDENGRLVPVYANPTTSTRFKAFIPAIVRHHGVTALAGKGGLDEGCVAAMEETGCVYFSIVGGAAPLVTEGVREILETGWDDLITQFRLSRVRVERFGPVTVTIDAHGNSLYADLAKTARERLPAIMDELNAARRR